MIDGTGTNNNNILPEIVASMEISNHLTIDLADVVNVAEDRLSHPVVFLDVKVDVFR